MANAAVENSFVSPIARTLTAPFAAIWSGMAHLAETNSYLREVEYLQSLSDAQLAQRGLTREDIVRHVFGPRLGF